MRQGAVGSLRDRSSRPRGQTQTQQFCGFLGPGELQRGLDNGLISDSLSTMVADGNHGPENLKRQAGQLPAQALNVKKDSRKAGKQESKKARKQESAQCRWPRCRSPWPEKTCYSESTAGLCSTADLFTDGRRRRSVPITSGKAPLTTPVTIAWVSDRVNELKKDDVGLIAPLGAERPRAHWLLNKSCGTPAAAKT